MRRRPPQVSHFAKSKAAPSYVTLSIFDSQAAVQANKVRRCACLRVAV